ncbi:MAG: MltA domain-containing protein, partial [bacterium]|nr:MltA domain-containing protein [bacterium]
MTLRQSGSALLAALLLSACAGGMIPPSAGGRAPTRPSSGGPSSGGDSATQPVPAQPRPALPVTLPADMAVTDQTTAAGLGVVRGPDIASLIPSGERSRKALQAFRLSCPTVMKRVDQSGLTKGSDWNNACAAASSWPETSASEFFSRYFEAVQVGDGTAFVTGYYEPEIAGSRTQGPGFDVPIYRRPPELVDVNLGLFSDSLKGKTIRGKVAGSTFVPFDDRAQIVGGMLAGRGLELAWAADPVEFFFLQVQGSGRLNLPDGTVMRIGYDGQNGRDYTGIGKLMKDRGLIQAGSMQDIMQYLRAHPVEGAAIMNENKS